MNLADTAYQLTPSELFAEAQRQFAMAEIADDFLAWFYARSGWFLLIVRAASTSAVPCGVPGNRGGLAERIESIPDGIATDADVVGDKFLSGFRHGHRAARIEAAALARGVPELQKGLTK